MAEGWIALHRKVLNHWVFDDRPYSKSSAWIDILLSVNWKDAEVVIGNKVFTCKRGESLMSLETWAKRWGWNKSATRRFLILLEKSGMIRTANETVTIRLTVCKYESYQDIGNGNETEVKRKRNARETQVTPIEQDNNETMEQEEEGVGVPPPPPPPKYTDDDMANAVGLRDTILSIDPTYVEGARAGIINLSKWADEFRLIRTRDKREHIDVRFIIDNLHRDSFWSTQIRSPGALRGTTKGGADKFLNVLRSVKEAVNGPKQNGKTNGRTYTPDPKEYAELAAKLGITASDTGAGGIRPAITGKV